MTLLNTVITLIVVQKKIVPQLLITDAFPSHK